MAKQIVNIGSTANAKNGDPLRTAFDKINQNFTELYTRTNDDIQIPSQTGNANKYLKTDGAALSWATVAGDTLVNGDSSFSISSDGTLTLTHPDEPALHPLSTVLTVQKAAGNYHTISGAYGLSLQATPVPSGFGLNTNTNFVDIFHDGISVNVNDNTWTFGTDGDLTLPNSGELRPSTAAYDSALAGWEFIRGGEITNAINNNLVPPGGWPMVDWYPTGATAQGYIDFLLNARTLQNTPGATLIIQPPMSVQFYNDMRAALIAIRDSYNTSTKSVSLSSAYGQSWNFGATGSLTLPAPAPITFTATLAPVYHAGGGGNAWYYTVIFQPNVNGDVVTMISGGDTVWDHNPGYQSGDSWNFTEADHGIPGYTFTFILDDISNGPAGWTANFATGPGPEYPSTVKSTATIKLSADTKNWNFSTDGKLLLPGGNAQIVVESDDGVRIGTSNLNVAPTSQIKIGGADHAFEIFGGPPGYSWKFDATGSLTFPNNSTFDGQTLTDHATGTNYTLKIANGGEAGSVFGIGTGDATYGIANDALNHAGDGYVPYRITASQVNLTVPGSGTWTFATNGSLTLPDASVIASYKPVTVIAQTSTTRTIVDQASASYILFTETVDTANAYANGVFTAPYTGYYQFNVSIYFSTSVTLNSGSFFLIDNSSDSTKRVTIMQDAWSGRYLHYSTVVQATAGDSISCFVLRNASGANIELASGCRLTIHRVSIS